MATHRINTCNEDAPIKYPSCGALKQKYIKEAENKGLYALG